MEKNLNAPVFTYGWKLLAMENNFQKTMAIISHEFVEQHKKDACGWNWSAQLSNIFP